VIALTNIFPGTVFLRCAEHEVREFVHTNYWHKMITAYWLWPSVTFAPKQCYHFEASAADFIEHKRPGRLIFPRKLPAPLEHEFPTLASELRPGCELVSKIEIHERKWLPSGYMTNVDLGPVVSPPVRSQK